MKRLLVPSIALVLVLPTACKPKTPAAAPVATQEPTATAAPPANAAPAPAADNGAPPPPPAPENPGAGGPGARGPGGGGQGNFQQRAAQRMERMKTELGLTEDQSQKISAIMDAQMASFRQGGSNATMSREDRRAAFQKAREATNAQIEPILTPEQKPKWQAMQQEMQNRRGGGQRPPQNQANP